MRRLVSRVFCTGHLEETVSRRWRCSAERGPSRRSSLSTCSSSLAGFFALLAVLGVHAAVAQAHLNAFEGPFFAGGVEAERNGSAGTQGREQQVVGRWAAVLAAHAGGLVDKPGVATGLYVGCQGLGSNFYQHGIRFGICHNSGCWYCWRGGGAGVLTNGPCAPWSDSMAYRILWSPELC